jgi:hypothetical protein
MTNQSYGDLVISNSTDEYCSANELIFTNFFFECFLHYLNKEVWISTACLTIILGSIVFNILAIIFLMCKSVMKSVFDQIIIGHALVNFLTGGIDLIFFYLLLIFNYWPLGKNWCLFYLVFDNVLATVEILHMLYLCWARIRCIVAPKSYSSELTLKYPYVSMFLLWLLAVIIWLPTVFVLNYESYEEYSCFIDFKSYLVSVTVISVGWILPTLVTIISTACVVYILNKKRKKFHGNISKNNHTAKLAGATTTSTHQTTNNKRSPTISSSYIRKINFKLSPQSKLTVMIAIFVLQYSPYSFIWLADTLCNRCLDPIYLNMSFLLTFLPSLTNPILVIILNFKLFFTCFYRQ